MGPADHCCDPGMLKIATEETRDYDEIVIVQEKLDGSNVSVAKVGGKILSLTRAGYLATTSPFPMHHMFARWVRQNENRFDFLEEGQRICGEWLIQAHGTRYDLPHEPFVVFDIIANKDRLIYEEFLDKVQSRFTTPRLISRGPSLSVETAMEMIKTSGHGAIDPVEGAVWRVEKGNKVSFLAKYVRLDKVDGLYLPEKSGEHPLWNPFPGSKEWMPKILVSV